MTIWNKRIKEIRYWISISENKINKDNTGCNEYKEKLSYIVTKRLMDSSTLNVECDYQTQVTKWII